MNKLLRRAVTCLLSAVTPLALGLAILTSNATCLFYAHQPREPEGLEKYKLLRKGKFNDREIVP